MLGIAVQHGGIGPAGGAFDGMVEAIGCFSNFRALTWNGQELEATTPSFLKSLICTVASCQ